MYGLVFVGIGISTGGYAKAPSYVAPQFSGSIAGLSTTAGIVGGIVAPYVTELITAGGTIAEWHYCMYLSGLIYAVGQLFFCLFGSGQVQAWAKHKNPADNEEKTNKIASVKF